MNAYIVGLVLGMLGMLLALASVCLVVWFRHWAGYDEVRSEVEPPREAWEDELDNLRNRGL